MRVAYYSYSRRLYDFTASFEDFLVLIRFFASGKDFQRNFTTLERFQI